MDNIKKDKKVSDIVIPEVVIEVPTIDEVVQNFIGDEVQINLTNISANNGIPYPYPIFEEPTHSPTNNPTENPTRLNEIHYIL
jgi:hypothetical protein